MAGANGIVKYPECDREEYINLKSKDTIFHQKYTVNSVTASPVANSFIVDDMSLSAATPNAFTISGTSADTGGILAGKSLNIIGSQWEIQVTNSDLVNDKVITLPVGFVPATITVPAGMTMFYTFEVTSTNPEVIELKLALPGGGTVAVVTTFTGAQGTVQNGPALVATTGDYFDDMVTIDTNIPGVITGATNVQQALTLLSNTPYLVLPITATVLAAAPGWVTLNLGPAVASKGNWPVLANIITDGNTYNATILDITGAISTSVGVPAAAGQLQVRIVANSTAAIGTSDNENDQTGGVQQSSVEVQYYQSPSTTYEVQANNLLGAIVTVSGTLIISTQGNINP